MENLTFISDPGHGWLHVTVKQAAAVGLTPADFSTYSYRLANNLFLEEDCDAGLYIQAYKKLHDGNQPSIVEIHQDPTPIRGYPSIH